MQSKTGEKVSLCIINEHFEPVFNVVAVTQIVFQQACKAKKVNYSKK